MENIKYEQCGGDVIGEGGYGCVFYPNHPCKSGKFSKISDDHVSKIIYSIDDEWSVIKTLELDKIDPEQKQLIYAVEKCQLSDDMPIDDIEYCKRLPNINRGDADEKDFDNLIIPYAGNTSFYEYDDHYNNPRELVDIYQQLLSAVLLLNDNNICHRDLKPVNIMIDDYNGSKRARIIDFGLAAKIHQDKKLEEIDEWKLFSENIDKGGYSLELNQSPYAWWPNDIFLLTYQKNQVDKFINGSSNKVIVKNILNLADNIYKVREQHAKETDAWSPSKGRESEVYFKGCVDLIKDVFSPVKTIQPEDLHYKVQTKFDVFSLGAVLSYDLSQWKELGYPPKQLLIDLEDLIAKMINPHPYDRITIQEAFLEIDKIIKRNF